MKKTIILALSAILMFGLSACTPAAAGSVVQSDKPQVTNPDVPQTKLASLVSDNNDFALALYQQLRNGDNNLFYSPSSISTALAMTYAGARGETEQQMAQIMRFYLNQDELHPAFNQLNLELAKRGEGAQGKDDEGFRLNIVNAIWGQEGYQFLDSFLDTLAKNYGAGLRLLDFVNAPEDSRVTINQWVSDQTEDRIQDLIPQGMIDTLTRLVLTNAIYFNAAWASAFNESATFDGTFHLLNGDEITVPTMRQTESLGYAEGNGYQTAELLYDGNELSMVILLPQSGQFENFEASLDTAQLDSILNDIQYGQVAITMPKFEFDSSFSLKNTLADMGMPIAFSDAADFSGMTGERDLFISEVVHKAFVSVDEAGTEAAAATAVIMAPTAIPAEPVVFNMDRPFIFLIRDIESGSILFIGRVMNPAS